MQINSAAAELRQSNRFLYLYALAVAGGAVAYVPFLTILLPIQAAAVAPGDSLALIAYCAFAGAISASIANIGFGWLSDIMYHRQRWIWAGLILSTALLIAIPQINGWWWLIAAIMVWQVSLNMMLAPLAAWAGDCVPDTQKGMLGGLLALAPALGAISGAVVTQFGEGVAFARFAAIGALVVCMVVPVLVAGRPRSMPDLAPAMAADGGYADDGVSALASTAATRRMWLARLLVQIAEASLFAFLLLWFRSLEADFEERDIAGIFALVLSAAVVLALGVGRWSDRVQRPILPLSVSALGVGVGLAIMAAAPDMRTAVGGYVVFGLASSVFLSLHSSQTLRVLPRPATRGRDLGIFNLTNTVPSLIMPWLTLALVPVYGFGALFVVLALLSVLSAFLLNSIHERKLV